MGKKIREKIGNKAGFGFNLAELGNKNVQLSPVMKIGDMFNKQEIRITHIKIDVDGGEFEVLKSLDSLLDYWSVSSVLIEISEKDIEAVDRIMQAKGFVDDKNYDYKNLAKNEHSTHRRMVIGVPERNRVYKSVGIK